MRYRSWGYKPQKPMGVFNYLFNEVVYFLLVIIGIGFIRSAAKHKKDLGPLDNE